MRIVSLHVASFGKLKNFDLNFGKGINVLRQKNGFGKTTLANFIRAMLYGFDYKRVKRGAESVSDAAWWATWNSNEKIGGNIVLEHNGTTYRVERYFGLTAKSETLTVLNVTTGKTENIQNVGEFFLGLTAESYERSAYFPQEAVEISSNENFDNRLAGLVQNDGNYDAVQDRLRKYRKDLKYERGEGGLISTLENSKFQLQRQLAEREQAQRRETAIAVRLQEIASERERFKASARQLNEQMEVTQANIAKKQLVDTPNKQRLAELQSQLARFDELENDHIACEALAKKIEQAPTAVTPKQSPIRLVLLIVGIVMLVAGVAACFWLLTVGIGAIVAGAAVAVISFFIRPAAKQQSAGEQDLYLEEYFNIASKYFYCKDMTFAEAQKAMWQTHNEYVLQKREYERLLQTASSNQNATQDESSLQRLRAQFAEIQQRQEMLSREEGSLSAERQTLVCDTTPVREQIAEVEQKIAEAKHNYDISNKVSALLERAKENLSVTYLPKLCDRCRVLLNQITAGDFAPVIDRTFSIKLQTKGVTKPLDNFSRGIREITLLCFRIALSEILFDGQVPFLIIDDAFVNFDEENFLRATELLRKLSQNMQILYLTCQARSGVLEKL